MPAAQPLWPVSTPALLALEICSSPAAVAEADGYAGLIAVRRDRLVDGLRRLGLEVPGTPASSFVLARVAGGADLRLRLRARRWAVRRGDTFPGLGPDWLRIAVRDEATIDTFLSVLTQELA